MGYLYGITSERRLGEEIRMPLAYRWFTRLGLEQEVPDHSTFSKNRHGRFRQSGIFLEIFEEIVRRCIGAGLVEGQRLTVDGTMVAANASPQRGVKPWAVARGGEGFADRAGISGGSSATKSHVGARRAPARSEFRGGTLRVPHRSLRVLGQQVGTGRALLL